MLGFFFFINKTQAKAEFIATPKCVTMDYLFDKEHWC